MIFPPPCLYFYPMKSAILCPTEPLSALCTVRYSAAQNNCTTCQMLQLSRNGKKGKKRKKDRTRLLCCFALEVDEKKRDNSREAEKLLTCWEERGRGGRRVCFAALHVERSDSKMLWSASTCLKPSLGGQFTYLPVRCATNKRNKEYSSSARQCGCPPLLWVLFVAILLLQCLIMKNNSLGAWWVFTKTVAASSFFFFFLKPHSQSDAGTGKEERQISTNKQTVPQSDGANMFPRQQRRHPTCYYDFFNAAAF